MSRAMEFVFTNSTNSSPWALLEPSPFASPSTTSVVAASSEGGSVSTSFNTSGLETSSSDRVNINLLGEPTLTLSPPEAVNNPNSIFSFPSSRSSLVTLIVTYWVVLLPASKVRVCGVNPSISPRFPLPVPEVATVTSVAFVLLAPLIVTPRVKLASSPSL